MASLPLPPALDRAIDTALDRSVALGFSRIGPAVRRQLPAWPADPPPGALDGRTVVVTGSTSGLGVATAEGVLALGARLVVVARNGEKAEEQRRELLATHPGAEVEVVLADLSDLDDVRRAANDLAALGPLDAIVHNAGTMPPKRSNSPQGHELSMALHVLGPVLLTELLLPALAEGARVVLVTSGGMYAQKLRADDPEYRLGDYSPTTAYARSKRAQVELLPLLTARWGDGVLVYATHPGWADTPGVAESLPRFRKLTRPVLRDADGGTDTTVWLTATEPAPRAGTLVHDRRVRPTHYRSGTRPQPGDVDSLWLWVTTATGLER